MWPAFDVENIDESWARISPAILALIRSGYSSSAQVAAAYYQAFRSAERADGTPTVRVASLDERRVVRNLTLVGPIWTKTAIGRGAREVAETAFVRVSGEVTRHVLNGSRETLLRSIQADRQALGFARVTSGSPCYFCAALAGRGAVYSEASVGFRAHSHCSCSSEPVYSREATRPGRGREFAQLWNESTRGLSGQDAVRAFRQAYEGR